MFYNFNSSTGLSISKANTLYVKTAGNSTIQSSTASIVGLTIQAVTSQTANLIEIKNSSGNILFFIDSQGNVNLYP